MTTNRALVMFLAIGVLASSCQGLRQKPVSRDDGGADGPSTPRDSGGGEDGPSTPRDGGGGEAPCDNDGGTDCLTCPSGMAACGTGCCATGQSCCSNMCATLDTNSNCGACGTVCGTGQTCSGTPAVCKRSDGQPCTTNAQCLSSSCRIFYRDLDGDGQGNLADTTGVCGSAPATPSGYAANSLDCCDTDGQVKKYQLSPADPPGPYFTSPATSCARPYDYNCDTVIDVEFPDLANCSDQGSGCPSLPTGTWWNMVPACGGTDLWGGFCTDCCNTGSCLAAPGNTKLQGCH